MVLVFFQAYTGAALFVSGSVCSLLPSVYTQSSVIHSTESTGLHTFQKAEAFLTLYIVQMYADLFITRPYLRLQATPLLFAVQSTVQEYKQMNQLYESSSLTKQPNLLLMLSLTSS